MKPADKSPLSALDWPLNAGTGDEVFRAVEARLRRQSRRRAAWAACGVALLATVSVLWQMRRPAGPASPSAVDAAAAAARTLPDGSVVELKDDAAKSRSDYSGGISSGRVARRRGPIQGREKSGSPVCRQCRRRGSAGSGHGL